MPHNTNTTNMALSLEEAKIESPWSFDDKGKLKEGSKPQKYPHGLEVRLDNIILKKLGLKVSDFKLDEDMSLYAKVKVESVRNEETLGNDPEVNITLQITELAIDAAETDLADKIYKS